MRYEFETLARLAREHGDAFYVLHTDRFEANLNDLLEAFRAHHPKTSIAYSYKTNYTPLLCRLADQKGCYAEVVSKLEYDLAVRAGVDPQRVIFNGPLKAAGEIEEALLAGAVVNLDSSIEIEAVEGLARRHPESRLRVGLRCHFALEDGHRSRFGIAADSGELGEALNRLRALPGCEIWGLHCHFSGRRGTDAFRSRAQRMVELTQTLFPSEPPSTIDIGGGFFGRIPEALRAQFSVEVPSYEEYAGAVAPIVAAALPDTELILEPGSAVVADVVDFVSRVGAMKRLPGRRVAITSGSVQNIKSSPNAMNQPMQVVAEGPRQNRSPDGETLDITGYTCMEHDVLYHGFRGELEVGDFVVISNVGAYTSVFKPPFIRLAPAMIAYSARRDCFSVARRREMIDDLLITYSS